jgi:hypothetical protein
VDLQDVSDHVRVDLTKREVYLSGGRAASYEHCPLFTVRGRVNGVALSQVEEGGWVDPPYSEDQYGEDNTGVGYCKATLLVWNETEPIDFTTLSLHLEDATGAIEFEVLGASGPTGLDLPPRVSPGERVHAKLLPVGVQQSSEGCTARYVGVRRDAAPGQSRAAFAPELTPTELGFEFDVPVELTQPNASSVLPFPDSRGPPEVECDFRPNVVLCEGAANCTLDRSVEMPKADLQVSQTSEPFEPPTDPLNWSCCGLIVNGVGAKNDAGCGYLFDDTTWYVSIGIRGDAMSYGFEIEGDSFEVGTEVTAPLRRLSDSSPAGVVSDCTLVIEHVWPATESRASIRQARVRCAEPAEPFYWDVREFEIRG